MNFVKKHIKGLLLVSFVVLISQLLSVYLYIGTVSISIILGMIINYFFYIDKSFKKGITFSEKYLLSTAIILMGAGLNFSTLELVKPNIIYIILIIIVATIFSSLIIGKIFNLSNSLSFLIGIGNGICGSSAIAGASSIMKSKKEDIALSISVINLLGTLGIFIVPLFINLFFEGSIENIGVIIGSTIQAVGQVTAAGFIMSNEIGEVAVITKMIRILMLGPILIFITFYYSISNYKVSKKISFPIPFFIIGFILFTIAVNYNLIPLSLLPIVNMLSKYSLLFAMAAIGLNISLQSILKDGPRVFLVGIVSFGLQIVLSIYLLS
mgnify:FL=1